MADTEASARAEIPIAEAETRRGGRM